MKHAFILIVAIMAMLSLEAKAQGLVYTPFILGSSSSSSSADSWSNGSGSSRSRTGSYRVTSQTQTVRTTAYYADYNGDYYKIPIRVEYTVYSNGASSLSVAEQWESNGYSGQWKKILTMANVESCRPVLAQGVTAELERTFMYKAMVGSRWYYFDL